MRVNARLDDSYETNFAYLQETTQLCVSDIVRESVDRYYEAVKKEQASRLRSLDALVGAFAGRDDVPADFSESYKQYLGSTVDDKFAHHDHRG